MQSGLNVNGYNVMNNCKLPEEQFHNLHEIHEQVWPESLTVCLVKHVCNLSVMLFAAIHMIGFEFVVLVRRHHLIRP